MKIFVGILLCIISTFIGYYFSKKYSVRRKFFQDFVDFNSAIKKEISFSKNTLISFIKSFENANDLFYKNLIDVIVNKKNVSLEKNIFTKQENQYLTSYLNFIGTSDTNSQLNFLNKTEKELDGFLEESMAEEKKCKPLYIKIGFLIGLIMFIAVL